ncbi:hypothetical protein B0O99DRAFT_687940 [Bisporella sp. PMI_857]|nr:hypothetical protein B0O99DRAFT_687940 [Bisporella sp. PMI_857]
MSGPLRRRTHARSKTGCSTCRERHVRCDERRPYCRNCVRLGRDCVFPAQVTGFIEEQPEALAVQLTRSQWERSHATAVPDPHGIVNVAPHHQGISSKALAVVQQSVIFTTSRPMPRCFWSTILKDFVPQYNLQSAYHDCSKYALVAFAAYTHYQASRSPLAEDVCIRHTTVALQELQKEIRNFGPSNADAIVTASVALAGVAENWDEWAVFVEGYSKTLSHIKASNFKTVYPDLLTDRFQLRQFASVTNGSTPRSTFDESILTERVTAVLDSIAYSKNVIGIAKWRAAGFEDLGRLAQVVRDAIFLGESDRYHQLAWLRSWMFWVDLRQLKGLNEEHIMSALFYALLLAIVPVFPTRYLASLSTVCVRRIQTVIDIVFGDAEWAHEVLFLSRIMLEWEMGDVWGVALGFVEDVAP